MWEEHEWDPSSGRELLVFSDHFVLFDSYIYNYLYFLNSTIFGYIRLFPVLFVAKTNTCNLSHHSEVIKGSAR